MLAIILHKVSTEVAYNFNIYLQKCIKVTYNAKT